MSKEVEEILVFMFGVLVLFANPLICFFILAVLCVCLCDVIITGWKDDDPGQLGDLQGFEKAMSPSSAVGNFGRFG